MKNLLLRAAPTQHRTGEEELLFRFLKHAAMLVADIRHVKITI
jgi:hypothetical protein